MNNPPKRNSPLPSSPNGRAAPRPGQWVHRLSALFRHLRKEGGGRYDGLPGRLRLWLDARRLRASPLFDTPWYRDTYPDVAMSGGDPARHYLRHGVADGRDPGPEFGTLAYLERYPDVAAAGQNPLLHYLRRGASEGREAVRRQASRQARRDLLPLPVFTTPDRDGPGRVTLVTDSVSAGSLFGGVGTALILGALLAERRSQGLRVVTRLEAAEVGGVRRLLRMLALPDTLEIEFLHLPPEGPRHLELRPADLLLTTSWWTTHATAASVARERILYLLQEDERMFYPHGDQHLLCAETLARGAGRVVINTELLRRHLAETGLAGMAGQALVFEPAFPEASYRYEPRPAEDRLNFFFYARPGHPRNLYQRGVEALTRALEEGRIDPARWLFHGVGTGTPLALPAGAEVRMIDGLGWDEYAALVRRMDAALSLMYTPHPSYPPLDLAASGAVVVTNRYGVKQSLAAYGGNILCVEPDVDSLARAIGEAAALAEDGAARRRGYATLRVNRDWRMAMEPVLRALDGG